MSVQVGVTLPQFRDDGSDLAEGAQRAVDAGVDSLWLFDHLWPMGNKDRPILECWSSLAYLCSVTQEVTVGTLVTRSSLRVPALLASMAATVASVAPGRLIVGVGSGDKMSAGENRAFGIPYLRGKERQEQLEAVLDTLAKRRDEDRVSPFQIWAGGRSQRAVEIAARVADGYNYWGGDPAHVREKTEQLAALEAKDTQVTWGGQVIIGRTETEARERLGDRDPSAFLVGDVATVCGKLEAFIEAGATHLVLASPFVSEPATYESIGEVAARLRDGPTT